MHTNVAMCWHVCILCASAKDKWVAGVAEAKLKGSCMPCSGRDSCCAVGQVPVTEDVTLYPMRRFEVDEWDNLVAYYALSVRIRQLV